MASTGASPEFWFIHLVCKMSSQTPLRIWYPPVSQLYNKIHPEFIYIQFINLWSYLGVEHSCLLACIYLLAPVSLRVSGTPTTTGKMIYPEISSGCTFIYGRCRHGIHWPEGNEYPGSSLGCPQLRKLPNREVPWGSPCPPSAWWREDEWAVLAPVLCFELYWMIPFLCEISRCSPTPPIILIPSVTIRSPAVSDTHCIFLLS